MTAIWDPTSIHTPLTNLQTLSLPLEYCTFGEAHLRLTAVRGPMHGTVGQTLGGLTSQLTSSALGAGTPVPNTNSFELYSTNTWLTYGSTLIYQTQQQAALLFSLVHVEAKV